MPKVEIIPNFCKSCQLCLTACPKNVLAVGKKANNKGYYYIEDVNPDACIGCKMCAEICPDGAIEVYK